MARLWQAKGAKRLHLVDLDGAFTGSPKNKAVIAKIAADLKIPVQLGGGLRNLQDVEEAFGLGVDKVILGTVAAKNPPLLERLAHLFGPNLIVGIDAKEGQVAIKGWVEKTGLKATELAQRCLLLGLQEIIYTDISRDGMLSGPNLAALEEMTLVKGLKVIASGGVSSLGDLKNIKKLKNKGVTGVIVGKALYDERFSLEDALVISGLQE